MGISLSVLVEQIFGYLLPFIGLSLLIRTNLWTVALKTVLSWNQNSKILFSVFVTLVFFPLGLLVVLVHNHWEWGASVIVTLLGWIMLIKQVFVLFFPEKIFLCLKYMGGQKYWSQFLRGMGLLYIILGFIVLCPYWF